MLAEKEEEGTLSLRFGGAATVSYLIAIGDGIALQALSDPEHDHSDVIDAGSRRGPDAAPRLTVGPNPRIAAIGRPGALKAAALDADC